MPLSHLESCLGIFAIREQFENRAVGSQQLPVAAGWMFDKFQAGGVIRHADGAAH
jgi:hypothetical protein